MAEERQIIQGEHRTTTVVLGGPPRDYYMQVPYRITELEFWILTKRANRLEAFAYTFLTASAIALANSLIKVFITPESVGAWEIYSPLVIAGIGILMFGIGRLLPDEYRSLKRKIDGHFESNPNVDASMESTDDSH